MRLLDFDPATGLLTAEAGITLAQILDFAVPRGYFLPVTPGTKYVTLGGAIANDIHGKNHHHAGTFGCHVTQFELVRSNGDRMHCSPSSNPDYYGATIAGMGLTGVITWAQVRLEPIVSRMIDYQGIQFHGIDEFLDLTRQAANIEYTVSWVDCRLDRQELRPRRVHARRPLEGSRAAEGFGGAEAGVPDGAPGFVLNHPTVRCFNPCSSISR